MGNPDKLAPAPAVSEAVSSKPSVVSTRESDIKNAGDKVLKGAREAVAKVDRYKKEWPGKTLEKGGGFKAGELVAVKGDQVRLRSQESGESLRLLRRGVPLKIAEPLSRFQVSDLTFIDVEDPQTGEKGRIAENYLKKIPERLRIAAETKSKVETPEAMSLRELIIAKLEKKYGKDAAPKKWDALFNWTFDRFRQDASKDIASLEKTYQREFGSNLHEDRVRMELENLIDAETLAKAVGKRATARHEAILEAKINPDDPENLYAFLESIGYEVGTYYGQGRMNGKQIAAAFGMNHIPTGCEFPGSRLVFDYSDGNIHFYSAPDLPDYLASRFPDGNHAQFGLSGGNLASKDRKLYDAMIAKKEERRAEIREIRMAKSSRKVTKSAG